MTTGWQKTSKRIQKSNKRVTNNNKRVKKNNKRMKNAKSLASTATVFDIIVLAKLLILACFMPTGDNTPKIGDKVLIYKGMGISNDSLKTMINLIGRETEEIDYYLRVHNVTDEGYNLVAQYNTALHRRADMLNRELARQDGQHKPLTTRRIKAKDRPMTAVRTNGGYWRAGHYYVGPLSGEAVCRDYHGRIVAALWNADTIVFARRIDSTGVYKGQMNSHLEAHGQGIFTGNDNSHYEGFFEHDERNGFGFESSPFHTVHIGTWQRDRFLGEKIKYTNERIYGIDISRHQHEKGRKRYSINWRKLRITSLGKRHNAEGRTFPVSFVYIKATEGTTIKNRYFLQDYNAARSHALKVGAYHFFSIRSSATAQAEYFFKNCRIKGDDFPPVLDVEPTDGQISQIGGQQELLRRIRQWLAVVEQKSGKRPILYVSQMFVNKYLADADDIKQKYNIWIARYGQYKPDVRLVYWQLCPDGKVDGISGDVDINVFNGYQGQYEEFVRTGFHK